jgi:MFS family permease
MSRSETVEDVQAQIEKLGRQRPEVFRTIWHELGFCFSLLASMLMSVCSVVTSLPKLPILILLPQEYFISGFNIILPVLANALDIPEQSRTWPANVFSLVTGALLLPVGRLTDMYGGYLLFTFGLSWFFIWSLIGGFSQNYTMLILCRALQGIGAAAFLPSGIMLLGKIYRPGPRKNLIFSLYGSCSPLGFAFGIFVGGLSGKTLPWQWYFWIGAGLVFLMAVTAFLCVPSDREPWRSPKAKMDWLGAGTIVPGLILVVFTVTDGSHAPEGWRTPYILATFLGGCVLLGAAVYIEGWLAKNPLLPFDVFQVKYMTPLLISLFFSYGVFGIYLFYASF